MNRIIQCIAGATLVALLFTATNSTSAQESGQQAEKLQELDAKVKMLLQKAEELQDEGRLDAAQQAANQAYELRALAANMSKQRSKNRPRTDRQQNIERLAAAVEVLKSLGRLDMAEQLQRVRNELAEKRADESSPSARARRDRQRDSDRVQTDQEAERLEKLKRLDQRRALELRKQAERREMEQRKKRAEDQRSLAERKLKEQIATNQNKEAAAKYLDVLRMARKALAEADRKDGADLLERMIHAGELKLEGRSAKEVKLPSLGQQVELLVVASKLWHEFNAPDRAHMVADLAEQYQERLAYERKAKGGKDTLLTNKELARRKRTEDERSLAERKKKENVKRYREKEAASQLTDHQLEVHRKHIAIMRSAIPALKEMGRNDTLEILERAIKAEELVFSGRLNDSEIKIKKAAPSLGEKIEVLAYSAALWREFGNKEKAAGLDALANHYREVMQDKRPNKKQTGDDRPRSDRQQKIAELEKRIVELTNEIERIQQRARQRR